MSARKKRRAEKKRQPSKTTNTKTTQEGQMAPKQTTTETAPAPQATAPKPPLEDDITAKEAFADDFVGLYAIGPNFHFTFATRRPTKNGGGMSRLVTARVVLPLDAVLEMYNALQTAMSRLESSGVVKRRQPAAKA